MKKLSSALAREGAAGGEGGEVFGKIFLGFRAEGAAVGVSGSK